MWVEGSSSWLQKLFIWIHRLVSSVMQLDTLLLSRLHTSRKEQELETYCEEDDYMEVDGWSRLMSPQKRNTWLLLLLLPLIFLAGKWYLLWKFAVHL